MLSLPTVLHADLRTRSQLAWVADSATDWVAHTAGTHFLPVLGAPSLAPLVAGKAPHAPCVVTQASSARRQPASSGVSSSTCKDSSPITVGLPHPRDFI